MAELIKKVKVMKQDGTFTNYIPLGADAANVKTTSGESVQTILDKIQQKKVSCYDSISSIDDNVDIGEVFVLENYDTLFTVISTPTISSLKISDNRYADVISTKASLDSLGITTTIDPTLFIEIVTYIRNKGIELILLNKTYNLNNTITLTNANNIKISGLGNNSNINYTGNDYAFIINTMSNGKLFNFKITCNGAGGIYFKDAGSSSQITLSILDNIRIGSSSNPIKSDTYMNHFNCENCTFTVSTLNGIGIDFSSVKYPDSITIDKNIIEYSGSATNNESRGIYLNNGNIINIINNSIDHFKYGFYMDTLNNTQDTNTINILQNNFSYIKDTAIYINGRTSSVYEIRNLAIKDCIVKSTTASNYIIHASYIYGLIIDNINIAQDAEHLIWLSNCMNGEVRTVNYDFNEIDQTKNQIGNGINYLYVNAKKTYTIPANGSVNVELGRSTDNLINFNSYLITRIGANNSTSGLTVSNYVNANGKINFTLSNSNSASVDVFIQGF